MTREEAYKIVCSIDPESIEKLPIRVCDAMHIVIQSLQDELLKKEPQGLDEAAKHHKEMVELADRPHTAFANTDFIVGAIWMAKQGVTKEAVIGMATDEIAINVSQKVLDALELCAGDKVIVQIRKEEQQ